MTQKVNIWNMEYDAFLTYFDPTNTVFVNYWNCSDSTCVFISNLRLPLAVIN